MATIRSQSRFGKRFIRFHEFQNHVVDLYLSSRSIDENCRSSSRTTISWHSFDGCTFLQKLRAGCASSGVTVPDAARETQVAIRTNVRRYGAGASSDAKSYTLSVSQRLKPSLSMNCLNNS